MYLQSVARARQIYPLISTLVDMVFLPVDVIMVDAVATISLIVKLLRIKYLLISDQQ